MTDYRQATIDTYNRSAKALAEYFRGIGSRVADIDQAFALAGKPKAANVLEIGCGDGRDAKEIIKRTPHYTGFDISEQLIALAKEHVPAAEFVVADATTFNYSQDYSQGWDIVFAFASLLHLDKAELRRTFKAVQAALKPGGILYISLKYAPEYMERIKEDQYGTRIFYFYNEGVIKELAGGGYELIPLGRKTIGTTEWFELALRKT